MDPAFTPKQRLILAVVPPAAAFVIRLLGATLRYEDIVEGETPPGYRIAGPSVFAFWHRSLLACAHRFRGLEIAILISPSFDGELVARTVERLGFRAVRGSSSRGGAAGLRTMQAAFGEGHRCAFTADGPRGPLCVAKPGAAQLARSVRPAAAVVAPAELGTWLGCFYALPTRAWQLRSWDGFLIPKPFARVLLAWPRHVPAAEVTVEALQAALDRAVELAEADPRVDPALRMERVATKAKSAASAV
ncbi:MAG: lysophospholipid acyltransferase family protein [Acidobacteriota bacterium]|nr:lysophospholipid acyltransferase family protein [Acidobacteriota bacterium]